MHTLWYIGLTGWLFGNSEIVIFLHVRFGHMLNLNFGHAFGFWNSFESLWKWSFHLESWPWYMQKLMRNESLIIWMTVDFLKTSK